MDKQKKYDPAKQPRVKNPPGTKYPDKWRRPGWSTTTRG